MSDDMYIARSVDEDILAIAESGGVVTSLLKCALEQSMVDGVVTVQSPNRDRFAAVPTLLTGPERLPDTAGSLHSTAPNIARFVKEYLDGASNMKLIIVGKPCDIRAIIELEKRSQINRDNVTLIGLNCTGTLPPSRTKIMLVEEFGVDPDDVVGEDIDDGKLTIFLKDGSSKTMDLTELEEKGYGRRDNCRRCEVNIPVFADLACGKWGTEGEEEKSTFVQICSEKGRALFEKALDGEYIQAKQPSTEQLEIRQKKDEAEQARAAVARETDFKPIDEMSLHERQDYWLKEFSKCIKCYGCRDACPICYCEHCLLEADRNFVKAGEIPPSATFPLTRLAHVADSCVNCGQCQDACPMELPLAKLFNYQNWKLRDIFEYVPGVDSDQSPPLVNAMDIEMRIDDTFLDIAAILRKDKAKQTDG